MALIFAGIDEAGYGPMLGPLCIGMSVFRVEAWAEGSDAPDLWELLSSGVCRRPSDKFGRVAIDDSKKLKGPSDRVSRHPLADLERGVLACLALLAGSHPAPVPSCDEAFFGAIGASCEPHDWYSLPAASLPLSGSADHVRIAANLLAGAMNQTGTRMLALRCRAIGEAGFNRIVERTGTKSAATGAGVTRHLRTLWNEFSCIAEAGANGARVVCDAQGGRTDYAEYLRRAIPGARVEELHRSAACSRYLIRGDEPCPISDLPLGGEHAADGASEPGEHGDASSEGRAGSQRAMVVSFMPEADATHLPVALASMVAKYTRELMMGRLNRYWTARLPDLKPTAGYALDARRWLAEVGTRATSAERATLVRRA
ncbi:MAG: hypothetical protein AB7G11_13600 [Phycisphaerales bacterium]